ncbi:hypothetical protein CO134_02230 [Candidatus Kuenenbacteria bacterium CG_4_9_14_3_um_filter_39_14]|uniref:Shedu protein SduA C-terminal domain-containing protein n=2 Tax=Parcubacteria group TaxID=1794811 RepID=A0A2M7Z8Y1_9BACT|nr:MAG: hypothetical protein COY31_01065 [Candidatus Wolfebacteria bacterium CG_4_10_14_0_2_um_filter_39_18]PJA92040.1 MAG: hypothetical protein CO134_02230 [Candidatus Kuenenbacteria bacterium CG_4_9_14_3_um_filter_39_14]
MKKQKTINYTNPKDPKDIRLVANINIGGKRVEYFVRNEAPQHKWIKKIIINGFDRLPAGFTKDGSGLAKGTGYLIVKGLYEKLGEFDLNVSLKAKNSAKKIKGRHKVVLNYLDLKQAIEVLMEIKNEGYQTLKNSANDYLNKVFPRIFKKEDTGIDKFTYQKNQVAKLLKRNGLFENFSDNDIQAVIDFFPAFIKHFKGRFKGKKKLIGILNSKEAADVFYLDRVISEFDKKLKAKTHSEQNWQKFFRTYIQVFNPTYATIFEKKNISLSGDFPDFVPIDIYGYLDIYEIKKPNTKLLVLDRSRKNYYWSSELSKAISQVENYIDSAVRLGPSIRENIKKIEDIDIKIVKPRGFIIAGARSQLKGEKMEDDFRILNESMKNIEIILFDDILNNLKNLFERIKNSPKKKKKK